MSSDSGLNLYNQMRPRAHSTDANALVAKIADLGESRFTDVSHTMTMTGELAKWEKCYYCKVELKM